MSKTSLTKYKEMVLQEAGVKEEPPVKMVPKIVPQSERSLVPLIVPQSERSLVPIKVIPGMKISSLVPLKVTPVMKVAQTGLITDPLAKKAPQTIPQTVTRIVTQTAPKTVIQTVPQTFISLPVGDHHTPGKKFIYLQSLRDGSS